MGGRLRLVRTQTPAQTCNAQSSMTHNRGARQPLFLLPRQQLQRRAAQKAECNLRPAHTLVLADLRRGACHGKPKLPRKCVSRGSIPTTPEKAIIEPIRHVTDEKMATLRPRKNLQNAARPQKHECRYNRSLPRKSDTRTPTKPRTHPENLRQDRKSRCKTCTKTQGDLQEYRAMPQAFCRHRRFAHRPAADCAPYAV